MPNRVRKLRCWRTWTLKWVGTLLVVLLTGGGALTFWRGLAWTSQSLRHHLTCAYGAFDYAHTPNLPQRDYRQLVLSGWVPVRYRGSLAVGWFDFEFTWSPLKVGFPLWVPPALAALPALYLWRIDRKRYPPGYCANCGYDLTGNVSGQCPECGTACPAA